jgi:hypothetical protein
MAEEDFLVLIINSVAALPPHRCRTLPDAGRYINFWNLKKISAYDVPGTRREK